MFTIPGGVRLGLISMRTRQKSKYLRAGTLGGFMGFVSLQELAAFLLFFWLLVTRHEHQEAGGHAHLEQDSVLALFPIPVWDRNSFQVYPGENSWCFQMDVTSLLVQIR